VSTRTVYTLLAREKVRAIVRPNAPGHDLILRNCEDVYSSAV
jgi:hypothetical protein